MSDSVPGDRTGDGLPNRNSVPPTATLQPGAIQDVPYHWIANGQIHNPTPDDQPC